MHTIRCYLVLLFYHQNHIKSWFANQEINLSLTKGGKVPKRDASRFEDNKMPKIETPRHVFLWACPSVPAEKSPLLPSEPDA